MRGNEPTGLPMAWSLAGAPTVVGSIWDIRYDAGTEMMRRFFVELCDAGNAGSAARALQRATQQVREQFCSAFHWGGWMLYGAP